MKKLVMFVLTVGVFLIGCSDIRRKPGAIYMPDMAYSRAYETYADHSNLTDDDINYTAKPVKGTIARGEEMPFLLAKDTPGDSTNYNESKQIQNPLSKIDMAEAERLYLVNCAICHGPKLDGNGPLYKGGEGPYPARPAIFIGDPKLQAMPEGQMFYSATYGKNLMGPYASQLNRKQRWMVTHYIKTRQMEALSAGGGAGGKDSTAAKKEKDSTSATNSTSATKK